ncbi:MAG TPA: Imm5 family immunity protein [Blastocatellia bacterium]|nr:Imm5 family immunity protein [Blastocatellia bacterium]
MPLPAGLRQRIDEAQAQLAGSKFGHLLLAARRGVLAAFGPVAQTGTPESGMAHVRRVNLAILCSRQVLPVWKRAYPNNDGPERMLTLAAQVVKSQVTQDEARLAAARFWNELGGIKHVPGQSAVAAGYAAACTVTVARVDEILDPMEDESIDDDDDDPYSWSVSFYAMLAYANVDTGRSESGVDAKREYWDWYLTRAVPLAYESVV